MGRGTPHRGMVSPSTWICWGNLEARQGVQILGEERPVLEKAQEQQVEDHRLGHEPPGLRSLSRYFSTSRPWV